MEVKGKAWRYISVEPLPELYFVDNYIFLGWQGKEDIERARTMSWGDSKK